MKRTLILIGLLTAAAALAACSQEGTAAPTTAATPKEAPALPSDVQHIAESVNQPEATTTAAAAESLFTATGEFISPSRSELAPKMPGRVAAIYVDEGSRVERGQPLLALETAARPWRCS